MPQHERIPLSDLRMDPNTLERILRPASAQEPQQAAPASLHESYTQPPFKQEHVDEEKLWAKEVFRAAWQAPPIKAVRGSVYPFVRSVLLHTDADWQGSFPQITRPEIAELSRATASLDIQAYETITNRHDIVPEDWHRLRSRYARHIEGLSPAYADSFADGIPAGVLSEPPHYKQHTGTGCTISCFRMIFAGIAGDSMRLPAEYAISAYEYANADFDESVMFRALASPYFKQKTGRTVLNRVLVGATFDDITMRAKKVIQTYPGSDVYAMVGVKNFDAKEPNGLHAVVLLDADDEKVTFHNPLDRAICGAPTGEHARMGAVRETLDRREFVSRWASGLYTAQMVFALPPEPTGEAMTAPGR